ncbi:3'-5' exonuclease [Klebsiella pasteurii]|uniref:3'-5' exoribonuclease n=1 Tax=Klebsiella pasteurii TaxID=2587529 RepID=A0ABT5CYN6_9ENTR|nr:3'-5' exonuclease [Klebsiella pasteurii]MDC0695863.1 3'-5' exoribonuclease [Klebsiella pasteurii]MDC0758070.1 3'-5' exoribonuclease [Klebsiella pasteurii]MDQ2170911.1 3'-5' exonuclease [Klebsiella pasteurii]MDQ2203223.1 3'-5' exonuclease [Klebsiella pasteurii]MDQ2227146.1 3'-5' exonuclease [Klebsiella pasteurii]
MNHLMIDLETMDNKPTSAIASIGAVFFEPETGEMGEQFYQRVSLDSCVGHGLTMGAETVLWWMRQDAEARSELLNDDCLDLPLALANLESFITEHSDRSKVHVWGNGAAFDNVILRNALEKCGFVYPLWYYWNDRDVRTVTELSKTLGLNVRNIIKFEGVKHHALYDAIHQAKVVSYVWMYLVKIASVK